MAEHLRLEHRLRDAAHVDLDEACLGTPGGIVQQARDDALAGAVLAEDQHVRIRRSDPCKAFKQASHGWCLGDETFGGRTAQQDVLGLQALATTTRATERTLVAEHAHQARVVPGLFDEIAGTATHRLDGDIDRAPGRHHHDRKFLIDLLQLAQQFKPFGTGRRIARVVEIDQGDIEAFLLRRFECLGRALHGRAIPALAFQQQAQGLAHITLVVGDEDVGFAQIHGLTILMSKPAKSLTLRVTRDNPCSIAVAASSASISGLG